MKTFTKEELVKELELIIEYGWHEARSSTNAGAIGNTVEDLLGIEENNLPIPNAGEWELKTHQLGSSALLSLIHPEPSPRALKIVPQILIPNYGWTHKEAGEKYPDEEKSFRATLTYQKRTSRGFTFDIDGLNSRIVVSFNASSVDFEHSDWLEGVENKVGLGELDPQPYWGFGDLEAKLRAKLVNAFFLEAEKKKINGVVHFWYKRLTMLENFKFENFLEVIKEGDIKVDFDARTGHNHGTKMRIKSNRVSDLYEKSEVLVDITD